ncbi:MAG: hypothetical protein A2Z66_06825 [Chloroflexi bacterium RBG_13_66_10]|jgi:hypothetical protein|nr:MAG: hypothetical protein A2Z66_06825 [Chloroflexi bacterium RBG_13_66_10]
MSRRVNRRSIVLTLGALALLAAILACSISGGGPGSGVFRLDNQSGQTICYVYISPTTSSEWGDDWLGSTEVVEDGDTRDFSVSAGDYDLRADTCDGTAISEVYGVTVPSGGYTWTVR